MNYYIDTEFIEGFHARYQLPTTFLSSYRPAFTIDLISIGIVSEDGREYYAVSKDFDLKLVWNKYDLQLPESMGDEPVKVYWLRENVLRPLHKDLCKNIAGDMKNQDYFFDLSTFSYKSLKRLISIYGKTNDQIADEIKQFTAGVPGPYIESSSGIKKLTDDNNRDYPPVFYGYYADYHWVLFCSLFGRMLDLPKGYPMYCRDLKQMLDEAYEQIPTGTHGVVKPTQVDEHHALADARWNRQLHENIKIGRIRSLPSTRSL